MSDIHVYTHTYIYIYMCVHMCIYIYIYIYLCIYTYVKNCKGNHARLSINICIESIPIGNKSSNSSSGSHTPQILVLWHYMVVKEEKSGTTQSWVFVGFHRFAKKGEPPQIFNFIILIRFSSANHPFWESPIWSPSWRESTVSHGGRMYPMSSTYKQRPLEFHSTKSQRYVSSGSCHSS